MDYDFGLDPDIKIMEYRIYNYEELAESGIVPSNHNLHATDKFGDLVPFIKCEWCGYNYAPQPLFNVVNTKYGKKAICHECEEEKEYL